MSPAQFIAFINDLLHKLNYGERMDLNDKGFVPETTAHAFADDLIIHTSDIMGVKMALNILFEWC